MNEEKNNYFWISLIITLIAVNFPQVVNGFSEPSYGVDYFIHQRQVRLSWSRRAIALFMILWPRKKDLQIDLRWLNRLKAWLSTWRI